MLNQVTQPTPITNEIVGMRKYDNYSENQYTIIGNDGKNASIHHFGGNENQLTNFIKEANIRNPVILLGYLKSYHIYYG